MSERLSPVAGPRPATARSVFGHLPDGTPVEQVVLRASGGAWVRLIAWGAAVQALHVPDRDGVPGDVVLGHDTLEPYLAHPSFFGATIGRYGNRIADGRFVLDGRTITVPAIDNGQALHGGIDGFDKRLWSVAGVSDAPGAACVWFERTSPDGEEGFPGTLRVRAGYTLAQDDASCTLTLDYEATTDAPTVVNLTNHTYFNLAGGGSALGHVVGIEADRFAAVTPSMIPTGILQSLDDTPLDFRTPVPVGARIRDGHDLQLALGRGYDHSYALRDGCTNAPTPAARVAEPATGRILEIATTEPAVQFYSGNFLTGALSGKNNRLIRQGDGLCFETQHHPDSPNQPDFPSTRLDPGQTWRSRTVWRFTTSQN